MHSYAKAATLCTAMLSTTNAYALVMSEVSAMPKARLTPCLYSKRKKTEKGMVLNAHKRNYQKKVATSSHLPIQKKKGNSGPCHNMPQPKWLTLLEKEVCHF